METFLSEPENFHKIKYKSQGNKKNNLLLLALNTLYANYRRKIYFEVTDLRKTCNLKLI